MKIIRPVEFKDFNRILENSWSRETSSDPERWNSENPAWGQCAVTSALTQDVFGGEVVWANALLPNGEAISHYFNFINGSEADFTRLQFLRGTEIPRGVEKKKEFSSTRDYVLSFEKTLNRYKILKQNFKENMDVWSNYLLEAWEVSNESSCKKMNFGAVLEVDGKTIEGFNHHPHPSLESYCDPVCIREGVPSGTKGELYPCAHAEREAIVKAHHLGYSDLSKGTLYVAGKFADGKKLVKDTPGFYCTSCAVAIAQEGINKIVIPSLQGEAELTLEEIIKSSFDVALKNRNAY